MGTPDFAVPSLRALCEAGYDVAGVFCQPDRPKGRGHKLAPCPVKETALALGIPVFQPERIKRPEGVAMLRALAPDLCVTAAFGQLLSQEILDIPPMGTVNVHASLLPRHRGSAPINWCIMQGDSVTAKNGYTIYAEQTNLDEAFLTAAMALENVGDVSDKVEGMYGYYIIQYTADVVEGPVALEEVSETLSAELLSSKQETTYDETMDKWIEEANPKINYDALKD